MRFLLALTILFAFIQNSHAEYSTVSGTDVQTKFAVSLQDLKSDSKNAISCEIGAGEKLTIIGVGKDTDKGKAIVKVPEKFTYWGCPKYSVINLGAFDKGELVRLGVQKEEAVLKTPELKKQQIGNSESLSTEGKVQVPAICTDCQKKPSLEKIPLESINKGMADLPKVDLISEYSNHPKVNQMITVAMKRKHSVSQGWCNKYVKNAMVAAGVSSHRLGSYYARDLGPYLEQDGFTNLLKSAEWKTKIKSPADAPKGAILVYGGGPGHVEIKTSHGKDGGYVSDYFDYTPRTGNSLKDNDRVLIGVYIKKDLA